MFHVPVCAGVQLLLPVVNPGRIVQLDELCGLTQTWYSATAPTGQVATAVSVCAMPVCKVPPLTGAVTRTCVHCGVLSATAIDSVFDVPCDAVVPCVRTW